MTRRPFVRRVLGEPLAYFALMGALLFVLDGARKEPEAEPARASEPRRIIVDAQVRESLREEFARANAREPTPEDLDQLIDGWVESELLYREGLARGLAEDDPIVRQRVAGKMAFVLESRARVAEPTLAELRAWYDQHRDRWRTPELYDFSHVFFAGPEAEARQRAGAALAELERGTPAATLGDRFSGGRRYRRRKLDDLKKTFGDAFAHELSRQPVGKWLIRRSRFGVHVVRLEAREPEKTPNFEAAQLDVKKDWQGAQKSERYAREIARLRERWEIVKR